MAWKGQHNKKLGKEKEKWDTLYGSNTLIAMNSSKPRGD